MTREVISECLFKIPLRPPLITMPTYRNKYIMRLQEKFHISQNVRPIHNKFGSLRSYYVSLTQFKMGNRTTYNAIFNSVSFYYVRIANYTFNEDVEAKYITN